MHRAVIARQSQQAIQHVLDLLFPPQCAACKRSGHTILCSSCLAQIQPLTPPLCQHCSSPHILYGVCQHCRYHPLHLSGLRTVSSYQEPLRSCIHALKYDGNRRLAQPLGALLTQAYISYGMEADAITPVPLHSERQQQRGYNQAQLLAEVCATQLGVAVRNDLLVRQRATPTQVGLALHERQQNVEGAFLCTPFSATGALYGRKIIIVDDVCTTGATLEACAAPLFAAGAQSVWGLVLARPS